MKKLEIKFKILAIWARIYFNCEHVHFVYIEKQKQTKNFVDFIKKNVMDFQNYQNLNFFRGKFLKIRSFINLPYGHAKKFVLTRGPTTKIGLNRLNWIQTNRQMDKQSIFIDKRIIRECRVRYSRIRERNK